MVSKIFTVIILVCILNTRYIAAQEYNNQCEYIQTVMEYLSELHYHPPVLNKEWSNRLWTAFISDIDPQGFYFLQEDIDNLSRFRDSIAFDIYNGNCSFFEMTKNLYKQELLHSDSVINQYLNKSLTFNMSDSLTIYKNDSIKFPTNEKSAATRWKMWLKYRTLVNIFTIHKNLLDSMPVNQLITTKEKEARILAINKHKHQINQVLNRPEGYDKFLLNRFLHVLTNSFDPHTSFLSYADKKDFESDISTETYTFGFDFEENQNGELEITHIIPGGPAWKSNEINKGDIMVNFSAYNNHIEDLTFSDEYDIQEIFNRPTINQIRLTVRKLNGQQKTVTLIKEKLSAEENLIKSVLLKGSNKIGYISLPGFYTEWGKQGNGCTNDMAREIIKLKKEKIEGLIIDLRFNGGGSMQEAISLAGIFINEGPVCLVNDRTDKPYILKDDIRGSVYNGPLILLVNGYSASSSEILASALQDYNRAIIVGSPTYGKASSQIIYPIDTTTRKLQLMSPDEGTQEYIKVTTNKLYRITGNTFQKTGVIPDIVLPGNLDFGSRESDNNNALTNDKISKNVRYIPLKPYPIEELGILSVERIKNNRNFQDIIQYNDSLKSFLQKNTLISLNPKNFYNNEFHYFEMFQKLDSISKVETTLYTVTNPETEKEIIEINPYKKEMHKLTQEKAQKDIYIQECYQILFDLINFKGKTK